MLFNSYLEQLDSEINYRFKNEGIISKYLENSMNINTNEDFFKDIDLESYFKLIDKTKTHFGSVYLKKKLFNPSNDLNRLMYNKKNIISFGDASIYDFCNNSLEEISKIQNSLLQFYDGEFIKDNNNVDAIYFNDYFERFNKNETILNCYNFFNIYYPAYSILSPVILLVIPLIIMRILPHIELKNNFYFKSMFVGIPTINMFDVETTHELIVAVLTLVLFVYNIYIAVKFSYHTRHINNHIKKTLQNIKRLIDISNEIFNYKNIGEILKFKKLDNKFRDKFNNLENNGNNMVLFREISKNKEEFLDYIKFISQIDYYININKLIKEHEYKLVLYNTNLDKPVLNIENFKHPYLNNGIENSIKIGDDVSNNIIITGPNASGKSTLLKSILFNIILSQTLSIGCCSSMEITPFKNIYSYLSKGDKLGKMSLFEKEIHNLTDYLSLLENKELSFILIDEIMSGTNFNESTKISYAICSNMNKFKNNISIITTHNNKITKLEKKQKCINYKMEINKNTDSIYTYKLVKGISNDYLGMDILKSKLNKLI